ncbi:MAG: Rrf2 family transcriptional regulator, partial [Steroidobacteraceae bacterium]
LGRTAMLRNSKLTDYGTVILSCLAAAPSDRLTSTRGARGGYELARPAAAISAAEIIDAIEGPVAITECSGAHSTCAHEVSCSTGSAWQRINGAIRRSLDEITLAQLSGQEAVAVWRPHLGGALRPSAATRGPGRI